MPSPATVTGNEVNIGGSLTLLTVSRNVCTSDAPRASLTRTVTRGRPTSACVGNHVTRPEAGLIDMPAGASSSEKRWISCRSGSIASTWYR